MKRNTFFRLFCCLALLPGVSCKKFVNLTPQGVVPVSSYYQSETDINNALTGIYSSLRPIYNNLWAFSELPSDNTQTYNESEGSWGEQDKFSWIPSSANIQTVWSNHYKTIALCNILLGRIDGVGGIPQSRKDQYIAQAQFVRALMYFNLVRMFGNLPIVLKELKTEAESLTYKRASVAEVYAQIEKDLNEAAAVLPAAYTGTNIGRATSTAAKGILGKVYLYQAKYSAAEAKLAEILPLAPAPLPAYDRSFGIANNNNADIVFSIQYLSGGFGEGNSYAVQFVPQPSGSAISSVGGNSFNSGTVDLYQAFEPGDLRRDIAIGVFTSGSLTYYYAKKFTYATVAAGNEGGNNWPVLRFAEVLLLYAEALNKNGKTDQALGQLNLVRTRSGLTAKTGLTQIQTDAAIQQERRVELCFEGERWWDLVRWGNYVTVMQAFKDKYTGTPSINVSMGNIVSTLKLFPVPANEIFLNPNLLPQNEGY